MADTITARTLNRTTLQRQLLLERAPLDALSAVHQLVGLQAQVPTNPYPGLWSRLEGFARSRPGDVARRAAGGPDRLDPRHHPSPDGRRLPRASGRCSGPSSTGSWPRIPRWGRPSPASISIRSSSGRGRCWARSRSPCPRFRAALGERFPAHDAAALAYACRNHLALVQVPPRGLLGRSHQVTVTTAEAWLGRPLAASPSVDDLVLRYLRAFGPATAADIATWSRLTGIAAVLDRLGAQLRQWTDDAGRTLWDVADGELADPETPAPVRLLPEYDNVLLAHADRSRFFDAEPTPALYPAGQLGRGHVLVDGTLRGSWRIADGRLDVLHLPLSRDDLDAIGRGGDPTRGVPASGRSSCGERDGCLTIRHPIRSPGGSRGRAGHRWESRDRCCRGAGGCRRRGGRSA